MRYIVSFDIDNTLLQSSAGHMESLIGAIHDVYGLVTRVDVISHHGMTDQEIIIKILEKYDVSHKAIRSKLNQCQEVMRRHYAQIVQSENIVMLEGVGKLLSKLDQKGFLLGLVTGNLESIAQAKLKKIGIFKFFKFGGFGSDHISRTELIKIAIEQAGSRFDLDKNHQVYHIGDAPQDMRAAREAGVTPIGVTTGIFSAAELTSAGAYRVVPNFTNADAIIKLLLDG